MNYRIWQWLWVIPIILAGKDVLVAQNKISRPGYYIDRTGHKFEGYFAEKISQRDLKGVWFKENPEDLKLKIRLETIDRIYLDDGDQYLIYELEGPERTEQLILRKIVDGQTNLYQGNSSSKGAVYYWEGTSDDGNLLINRDNFKGFANSVALRCEEIDASDYKFSLNHLTDLAVTYNGCRNAGSEVTVAENLHSFRFNLGLRPYWYSTKFTLAETTYYGRGEYSSESGFSTAIALALRIGSRIRVMLEPGYTRILSSSNYVNVPPYEESRTYSEVTFDLQYVDLPILVQYRFPFGTFRPFAEGGLNMGIPVKREVEDNLIVADPSHNEFKPSEVAFEESYFGLVLGAGVGFQLASGFDLEILGRWTKSASSMKVVSAFNEGFPVFNNFSTDKFEVGIRFWWLGKSKQ